jgi:hypothetical protein
MRKERPILLLALAVANWSPPSYAQRTNHGNINVPAISTVEPEVSEHCQDANRVQIEFNQESGQPFGSLPKLSLVKRVGRLTLNGVGLEKVTSGSIDLVSPDQDFRVRATFLKTVVVANGEAMDSRQQDLIKNWSESIPMVAEILKRQDGAGSLKPVIYDLIGSRDRRGIQFQEQLTLLCSNDPTDEKKIGHSGFGPLLDFSEPLADVQYRSPDREAGRLPSKTFLQILYLRENCRSAAVGAFVIVSKPSGDYEFYSVPTSLLNQLVIDVPFKPAGTNVTKIQTVLSKYDHGFKALAACETEIENGDLKLSLKTDKPTIFNGQPYEYAAGTSLYESPQSSDKFYGAEMVVHYSLDRGGLPYGNVPVQERLTVLYENTARFNPLRPRAVSSQAFTIRKDGTFIDRQVLGSYEQLLPDTTLQVLKQELVVGSELVITMYIVRTPRDIKLVGYSVPPLFPELGLP